MIIVDQKQLSTKGEIFQELLATIELLVPGSVSNRNSRLYIVLIGASKRTSLLC